MRVPQHLNPVPGEKVHCGGARGPVQPDRARVIGRRARRPACAGCAPPQWVC